MLIILSFLKILIIATVLVAVVVLAGLFYWFFLRLLIDIKLGTTEGWAKQATLPQDQE